MFLKDSLLISIWRYIKTFESYIGKKIYFIFALSFIAATAESLGLLFLVPLLQEMGNDKFKENNFIN